MVVAATTHSDPTLLLRLGAQGRGKGFDLGEGQAGGVEGAEGEFSRVGVAYAWADGAATVVSGRGRRGR